VLGSDIFIVHGHDEAAKEKVAGFIRALGLNPVILHEKPNKGRTLIEKFRNCTFGKDSPIPHFNN
jgi:predicted nucleotide-binding protein